MMKSSLIASFAYATEGTVDIQHSSKIADKMQMYFEVSFSPDFSNQLYSPSGTYVTNNGGNTFIQNFPEEKVTNLTIELSVGIKFFRY